jgi:hypothetical protein
MQNFLAKAVAVAMLVGGFSLTGDLGWIAEKGQRIVGAADVPTGFDAGVAFAPEACPTAPPPQTDDRQIMHVPTPTPEPPPAEAPSQPLGGPEPAGAAFKPPVGGPQEITWASLGTGSRVVVWLAGPPYRCLVLDFVDPVSGEALLYEVATVDSGGKPIATAGPPRRVIVGRDASGRPHDAGIIRGGSIQVAQAGVAAHAAGQWLGPIAALGLNP